MRAEDLFEAMEGIDEDLIARSEIRMRRTPNKQSGKRSSTKRSSTKRSSSKRKKRRDFYRYAVISLSTAAVVLIFLMARDFLMPRVNHQVNNSEMAEEAAGDSVQAEASEDDEMDAMMTEESEQYDESDSDMSDAAEEEDTRAYRDNGAEGKTAVDLLGDMKGDYVSLEYISAEDEQNGGNRKVPDYSEEGEEALSAALENGKPEPSLLASKGDPTYYVYLMDSSGREDKVTFYLNCYVSMDSIPGVVMKISETEYQAVLDLFD